MTMDGNSSWRIVRNMAFNCAGFFAALACSRSALVVNPVGCGSLVVRNGSTWSRLLIAWLGFLIACDDGKVEFVPNPSRLNINSVCTVVLRLADKVVPYSQMVVYLTA